MHKKTALVVGASGVIGHAAVRHIQTLPDWSVLGMGRRPAPDFIADAPWVSVDLDDPVGLRDLRPLGDVTHVFYAAYVPDADLAEEARVNGRMLRNLLRALEAQKAPLERVALYQGGKVYGLHLGPVKTPMRETDPRHMPPNFYYDLEEALVEHASSGGWSYTLLRPDIVLGAIAGQPLNLAMVIGAYAALCRELRAPFRFPGTTRAYGALAQATDADLLARVSLWAATAPIAANQAYNVTNGDLFRWENLWPWLGDQLGLPIGPPMAFNLTRHMGDKQDVWTRLAERHRLVEPNYRKAVGWGFGDFIFNTEFDVVSDLTKLRQHGCQDILRTEEGLLRTLKDLQAKRVIPPIFQA